MGDAKVASRQNMAHIHDHEGFFISPLPMYASYEKAFADALDRHTGKCSSPTRTVSIGVSKRLSSSAMKREYASSRRRKLWLRIGIDRTAKRHSHIERLATILEDTGTECCAWALIPNHFHLLLRTGSAPIAMVMRRLLTGHAISFNRRHRRSGHLFQNRYKSILCQESSMENETI